MRYPDGSEVIHSPGPFSSVTAVLNCRCEDGERRQVYITGQPDTFFSIPGYVKVKGKRVSGFYMIENDAPLFVASSKGKNAALINREYHLMYNRMLRNKQSPNIAWSKMDLIWDNYRLDYR